MGATTTNGFPYPVGTDAADVPYWMQQLAQAVDAKHNDTGWLTMTPSAGWTQAATPFQVRQVDGKVHFRGGMINASFTGGYTTIATMPAAITKPGAPTAVVVSTNSSLSRYANANTDGTISAYSSAASGATFYFGGSYPA